MFRYEKRIPQMVNAFGWVNGCLLYTSDAADERSSVDLGGRRIIKKKKKANNAADTQIKTKSNKVQQRAVMC